MALSSCCSAEVVLTTLLLEQIKLLKGLQSVDGEDELGVLSHTKTGHGILKLDVVEDDGSDVVGVLLSKGLVGSGLNLTDELVRVVQNCSGNLVAQVSARVVSLRLRVAHTERHVGVDSLEISLDRGKKSSLWVLLNLGSLSSSGLMGSDVGISDGVGSHVWESRDELVSVVVVVSSSQDGSLRRSNKKSNCKSRVSCELNYVSVVP